MKSLELNKPHILVVVGLPGAGKTFFAEKFSETFGAPFIDQAYYKRLIDEADLCDEIMIDTLKKLMITKQTIVLEGPGYSKKGRETLANLSGDNNYNLLYVWVQTDMVVTKRRATTGKDSSLTKDEFDYFVENFQPLEKSDSFVVISGKYNFQSQARIVLKRLSTETAITAKDRSKMIKNPPRTSLRGRIMG